MEEKQQLSFLKNPKTTTISEVNHSIYGKGICIRPNIPGKSRSKHEQNLYLEYLLPLEEYDEILLLFSGGKDSLYCLLRLLELNIDCSKLTIIHHSVDGNINGPRPEIEMDWPITHAYVTDIIKQFGLKIRFSWREGGFASELLRIGASTPVWFEDLNNAHKLHTVFAKSWQQCLKLKEEIVKAASINDYERVDGLRTELKKYGYRFKWPAKSPNLKIRWCSSILKKDIGDKIIRYSQQTYRDKRILVIEGCRRQESRNRASYNEMEKHSTLAGSLNRIVHLWRMAIDVDEAEIWEKIKNYRIRPHLAYLCGFSRCSCFSCLYCNKQMFAAQKELLPDRFNALVAMEKRLSFTIDNKKDLQEYVGDAQSCIPKDIDPKIFEYVRNGYLPKGYSKVSEGEPWDLPAGAFSCSLDGGPC